MTRRKMFVRMITASLLRRRSRMLVALLAIMIGAMILSGLVTIYYDVPRQMGAQFRNYGANMLFTAADERFTQADVDAGLSRIAADDLVGAAPYQYETVRIHEQPVMAAGTDMAGAQKTSPFWAVTGAWPQAPGEIMVGSEVASALNIREGDVLPVTFTPEAAQEADAERAEDGDYIPDNELSATVTGILKTGGSEEEYIYLSLADLAELTGKETCFDLCEVSVQGTGEALASCAQAITDGVPGINARLVKRVTQSEATVLGKLQALVLLVTVVVLALTMICVATTMTAVVEERRKEIGLRKALGASDGSIIGEFMGEGLLLGALGGAFGAILGFLFAQGVSVSVFSGSISFRAALLPVTIAASVLVTGIACLIPVMRATNVDPALVLKGE